jgi:tetratricopeptide (TPR) repeat protein
MPRWLPVTVGVIVAGAVAGSLIWWFTRTSISPCEAQVRSGNRRHGVAICLASYARTGDERDLVWAAKAEMYLGELDEADRLAHRILAGPHDGDAQGILSYVALRRGSGGAAAIHAAAAFAAHTLAGDDRGRSSDAVSLSQAAWQVGDFTAALDAADEALRLARGLRDPHYEVAADLARADVLRRIGDLQGTTAALADAIARASDPCDRAWARLKNGMCQFEAGQDSLAMLELTMAEQANRSCGSRDISMSATIIQAWLLRWKDPAGALARLDELAKSDVDGVETLVLRGYLAADRGALAEADHDFMSAASLEPPHADWPWEIARARAELSELRGGLLGDLLAEYQYRRATAMVASLRRTTRARSAFLVSSHRGPYDGLMALLARHGRWRDVLAVVLELDASDMLRATAGEVVAHNRAPPDVDATAPGSSTAPPVTVEDVLAAWRSRELVILIAVSPRQVGPGRERVYRLRIRHGQVTGEDMGDASAARKWADDLFADPGDRDAARALGHMIVPPGPVEGTLHVLAIGPLGKVPLAALRDDDGSLIVGRRPLMRVLALRANGPDADGAGTPVIITDPRGDLPSAAAEGAVTADALGPGAQRSGFGGDFPATRARLWAARDAALLHVAGHVVAVGRWRALRLADGDVDPAELVQRHLAPRIAVLAGCGSAAATDEEGWGSIAAALLESGTTVVIATDRSVGDGASLSVMRAFYAQSDWRTDPARALARVQQALDAQAVTSRDEATKPRSWAAFSVLGRPPEVPARRP